jgi:addiction module RelE/StbE family toxin
MKILFTSRAKSDISEIVQYISQDSPQAAREWSESIFESIKSLEEFPSLGRIVPEYSEESIREIIKGQYRIVYKINQSEEEIYIVTLHHSKRLLI